MERHLIQMECLFTHQSMGLLGMIVCNTKFVMLVYLRHHFVPWPGFMYLSILKMILR